MGLYLHRSFYPRRPGFLFGRHRFAALKRDLPHRVGLYDQSRNRDHPPRFRDGIPLRFSG